MKVMFIINKDAEPVLLCGYFDDKDGAMRFAHSCLKMLNCTYVAVMDSNNNICFEKHIK